MTGERRAFWQWLRDLWAAITRWIFEFPAKLDTGLRNWDLQSHRIDETRWHRKDFLEGYSKTAFWLPAVVLFFLVYGLPREFHWFYIWKYFTDRGWAVLAVYLVAFVLHLVICRYARGRWLPRLQFVLLAGTSLGVFRFLADPNARHGDIAAYPHIYALLGAIVLALAMPINRWLAERWILGWVNIEGERKDLRETFKDRLGQTRLFVDFKFKPRRQWSRLLRAFSLVPISSPILLVIVPSLLALFVPRQWLMPTVWVSLGLSWFVLAAGHYQERLSAFREIAKQIVVRGAPGVVSAIVVLLAVLRLVGVSYVTTVLDQSSKWVLVGFVVMLYYLFWTYEYWSQRALSEVLLGLLQDGKDYPSRIDYLDSGQHVPGRRLQIHGNGRLVAIEERPPGSEPKEKFYARPALEVFRWIHGQATGLEKDEVGDAVKMLEQRARLYRVVTPLLIAGVVGYYGAKIYNQTQRPGVDARKQVCWSNPDCADADRPASFKLAPVLEQKRLAGEPEVYAVAASGGGTRAAVYTYAVLKALRERDVLDRVVMVSGVSGGGMGLAYFLTHLEELRNNEPPLVARHEDPDDPWSCYREATQAAYIASVLAGSAEFRFLTGTRLGQLLTEGFESKFRAASENCRTSPKLSFGEQSDVGFIFNTSLAGAWRSSSGVGKQCVSELATDKRNCGSIAERGSRLALSNVASFTPDSIASTFGGWNLDFDYTVVNDPRVTFPQAASVNANFPPIFSNAAVLLRNGPEPPSLAESPDDYDSDGKPKELPIDSRYWITDGGAVENRGMISLLLALRSEIGTWPTPEVAEPARLAECASEPGERQDDDDPWIKVIVIEAAGGGEGYAEDRGASTALGAPKKIADKLIAELAREADRAYCHKTGGKGRVKIAYLPMPLAVSRAFGTHWQLLRATTVTEPVHWYREGTSLRLSGREILDAIDLLFASGADRRGLTFDDPGRVARLREFLRLGPAEATRRQLVRRNLWQWIGSGADGGANEDPRVRLERELAPKQP